MWWNSKITCCVLVVCAFILGCCWADLNQGDAGVCVVKISVRKTRYRIITTGRMCGKKKCTVKKLEHYNTPGKRIVCCNGWQYNVTSDSCRPVCTTGCVGGRCVAPEVCQCNPPNYLDPEHKNACLLPKCDPPCVNAQCESNNKCTCYSDHLRFNDTHCIMCDSGYTLRKDFKCMPICDEKCVNGECTEPNKCTCLEGFISGNVSNICEPKCDKCVNSICVAPNTCRCLKGYTEAAADIISEGLNCIPVCDNKCVNGKCTEPNKCTCLEGYQLGSKSNICEPKCEICVNSICVAPNTCQCLEGYSEVDSISESFKCVPVCENNCVNGECTEPNKCTCLEGYQLGKENYVCEPKCDGCINSICIAPNTCQCLEGYKQIADDYVSKNIKCTPVCDEECVNGECTEPNKCTCFKGYQSGNASNVCEPICDNYCVNSLCVAPNTCRCFEGYTKVNDSTCEPVCEHCGGECVAPNFCDCGSGYRNLDGVCIPVCEDCDQGVCVAPGVCGDCNEIIKTKVR